MRRCLRIVTSLLFLLLATGVMPVWSQCAPSVPLEDFVYMFGFADGLESDADFLALLENPAVITAEAVAAPKGDGAATVATTDVHVLYPIEAASLVDTLNDTDSLTDFVPDLAIHETICRNGPDMIKQLQRTEFNVLFFTFGTEYLIDVRYESTGPEEFASYWGMYESVDDKLAYQYGSWYFRSVVIDGRDYAYVRHFTINGIKTRVPGLRMMVENRAGTRVGTMLNAIFNEAVSRYGTSAVAASR